MSIGERLKLIRKESGLNQTEFGARINLSQTKATTGLSLIVRYLKYALPLTSTKHG